MAELEHTIEVRRTLPLRLFLWTYGRDGDDGLNTCWLFWGFLFMPLALPISMLIRFLIALIFRPLVTVLDKREARKKQMYYDRLDAERDKEPEPKKQSRALPAVANFMSKVWWKLQPALPWLGGLIVLIAVGFILWAIATYPMGFVTLLLILAGGLVVGLVVALIIMLITKLLGKFQLGRAFKAGGRSFHNHTCANIKIKD